MMGQLDMLPGQQQRAQEKPGEGPLQTAQHRADNPGQQCWMEHDKSGHFIHHRLGQITAKISVASDHYRHSNLLLSVLLHLSGSDRRNELVLLVGRGEVCMHYEQEEDEEEEEEETKASSKSSSV
ncbi:hypothetical protein Q5P01_009291 [Channa striata]|uniref:Uncharacterized protein n=1 Tax=Channa striata TaxID=64152 RepID=A0AA88N125_CHASR|nr:hypothetical protein Q5P01_009291 [Channa striata]